MADNSKLSVTLKAGTDYSAPWIVVHPDSVDEGVALLNEIAAKGLDLAAANAAKELQAKYVVASAGLAPQQVSTHSSQPVSAPQPTQSNVPTPAPGNGGDGRTCQHGAMTFRTGTNSRGAWTGYFCPSPKGTPGQCAAQFVR